MRTIFLILLAFLSLNTNGQMGNIAKTQAEKNELKTAIGTIELGTLKQAIYKKSYQPVKYKKFVYLFDNPDPEFNKLIEKSFLAWSINAVPYYSVVNPNRDYSDAEINQIFKDNDIEAMFIIGYNKEYFVNPNKSTTYMYRAWNNMSIGYSSSESGFSVIMFIDIYDIYSGEEPFIRARAESRTHVKHNISDLIYKNMVYTLRGLIDAKLLIQNLDKKTRKERLDQLKKES